MDPPVKVEFALRFGDILTSVSVLLALTGFLYSWRKDRRLRTKEYADKVRAAASQALAKIDRCESLYLSFIEKARPVFGEVHSLETGSPQQRAAGFDQFLKQMVAIRTSIAKQLDDEQIELAYAPLFAHRPDVYDRFRGAIAHAKKEEEEFFLDLLEECQKIIHGLPTSVEFPSTRLHDRLLDMCTYLHKRFAAELLTTLDGVRSFLRGILAASDEQLMSRA